MVNNNVETSVVGRVARLERENRFLRRVGCAVLLVSGSIAVMGQSSPPAKVIESEQFILKDASGRVRAKLQITDGTPILNFYDERGGDAASFGPTRMMDVGLIGPVRSPCSGIPMVTPRKKNE